MTFSAQETSLESGRPVELYQFSVGSEVFYLTSAEDDYLFNGNTYEAVSVARSDVGEGPEERNQILDIQLPAQHPFARKYISLVPGSVATVTILRVHRNDVAQESALIFTGRVRSVAYTEQGTRARIACLQLTGGLGRSGPRYVYSGLCNHVLYDSRCKVASGGFRFTAAVTGISGSVYTIGGLDAAEGVGWATAGFVQVGSTDFRLILEHRATDELRLVLPFDSTLVTIGTEVDVFAGCDHSLATCKTKFNNVANFGGFAFVPLKNPFATGLQ